MAEYCENCGAELKENSKFCQECGSEVSSEPLEQEEFCPNCGESIANSENFCENCGTNLNTPQVVKNDTKNNIKNILKKYQIPLIITATVIVVAVIIYATLMITAPEPDVGTQVVSVGINDFIIPGDYRIDPSSIDVDYTGYNAVFSQGYYNDEEMIYISVMNIPPGADGESAAASQGGVYKSLMGVNGYYVEDEGYYTFAFVDGAYLNVVATSSPYVFDQITYRG